MTETADQRYPEPSGKRAAATTLLTDGTGRVLAIDHAPASATR